MLKTLIKFWIAVAILGAFTLNHHRAHAATMAPGPSFNCRYAKTPDEVAICQDKDLSEADRDLSEAYFELMNAYKAGLRRYIHRSQVDWLKERHRCGSDLTCLRNVYDDQLSLFGDQGMIAGFCQKHRHDADCKGQAAIRTHHSRYDWQRCIVVKGTSDNWLALRVNPDAKSHMIAKISEGTIVNTDTIVSGNWLHVSFNVEPKADDNRDGWVYRPYTQATSCDGDRDADNEKDLTSSIDEKLDEAEHGRNR